MLIGGCAINSTPNKQDLTLPVPSNIKSISDSTEIGLEWGRIDDERVIGYEIYRSKQDEQMKLKGKINDRFATHYVDTNLEPDTQYTYQLRSFSQNALSIQSTNTIVHTRPQLSPVPFIQTIQGLPERVKIIWRPHPDTSVIGYTIYRANAKDNKFSQIADIKSRLSAEYIDTNVKSGETYYYIIYAKTNNGLSKPSIKLKATTKPLPKPVKNLKASKDGAKKIVISWDSEPFEDFDHYQIYKSSSVLLPYTKKSTTKSNIYEDLENSNGATRYYQISVVDKDGLESEKKEVVGNTLSAPASVKNLQIQQVGENKILLSWDNNSRAQKYIVYKKTQNETTQTTTVKTSIEDTIISGQNYTYNVIAVDKFGLSSDKSESVKFKINAEF